MNNKSKAKFAVNQLSALFELLFAKNMDESAEVLADGVLRIVDKGLAEVIAAPDKPTKGESFTNGYEIILSTLMGHSVRLETIQGEYIMTVGEMVEYASGASDLNADDEVYGYDYTCHLGRMGLIVDTGELLLSNSSKYIKWVLLGTPWCVNWHKILMHTPGATGGHVRRFASVPARAVAIPLEIVFGLKNSIGWKPTGSQI